MYTFHKTNNKSADQTARIRTLVRAFVVHMQQSQVYCHRNPFYYVTVNRIDWDEWEDWGPCSVSCETGWTTRRRQCIDTVTLEAVSPSKCFGKDVEYQACTLQKCPSKD